MNAANRQKWRDALPVVQRIADALGDDECGASGLCNACRFADWQHPADGPRCEHPIVVKRDLGDLAQFTWEGSDCGWFRPKEKTPRAYADEMLADLIERACYRADDTAIDDGLSMEAWKELDARLTAQGETIIREAGL